MKTFLEFYFPGLDCSGRKEIEVSSRNVASAITFTPPYSHSCRFFNKDNNGKKYNFSPRYWFGVEYSKKEFEVKYPQLKDEAGLSTASRIVKTRTGGFYPLAETDVVISV